MSAYICDRSVILSLVRGAVSLGIVEKEFACATADMLWQENIASVSFRHGSASPENLPGPIGENYFILEGDIADAQAPIPPRLLELIGEYNYQSCEHPAWEASRSCALMRGLKATADVALVEWKAQETRNRIAAREEASQQKKLDAIKGREMLDGRSETHCVIAELHEDQCDSQSDYFSSRRVRTVVLALSAHGKDLFAEMRKAALLFPETEHLGPGKNEWRVMKLAAPDQNQHWNGRLGEYEGKSTFGTREEAQAFLDTALARDKAKNDAVPFECYCPEVPNGAEIECDSVEHREKYSMGRGYYLQAGSSYSGWRVSKSYLEEDALAAIGRGDHMLKLPAVLSVPIVATEPQPIKASAFAAHSQFASACYIG